MDIVDIVDTATTPLFFFSYAYSCHLYSSSFLCNGGGDVATSERPRGVQKSDSRRRRRGGRTAVNKGDMVDGALRVARCPSPLSVLSRHMWVCVRHKETRKPYLRCTASAG